MGQLSVQMTDDLFNLFLNLVVGHLSPNGAHTIVSFSFRCLTQASMYVEL